MEESSSAQERHRNSGEIGSERNGKEGKHSGDIELSKIELNGGERARGKGKREIGRAGGAEKSWRERKGRGDGLGPAGAVEVELLEGGDAAQLRGDGPQRVVGQGQLLQPRQLEEALRQRLPARGGRDHAFRVALLSAVQM